MASCRGQCPPNLISLSDCVFRPRASFMTHNVCPAPAIFMETQEKKNSFSCRSRKSFIGFFLPLATQVTPCPYWPRMSGATGTEFQSCRVKSRWCVGCKRLARNLLRLQSLFSRPFVVMCVWVANESGKRKKKGVGSVTGWCWQACAKKWCCKQSQKVHKKATAPSSHARWLHKNQPEGCITAVIHWTQVVSQ